MKKILICVLAVVLASFALAACGASEPAATPEPTPIVTPEPTPEPTPMPTEMVLGDESADEILALSAIPTLKYIDGRNSSEYAAMLELSKLLPECEIVWEYELQGVKYPSDTTELTVTELEGLEDAIRYLPKLNYIDLLESPATVEDLDRYSEINPDIFFLWSFVHDGWLIRTDIEVYSSLRDLNYHRFTDEEMYPMLKYCKNLKMLDLGHNDLTDMSLIGELTDLEVLIIADNPNLVDASPLGNLTKLTYLEFFMNHKVENFDWLNNLTKLDALNMCYCDYLTELDFLENMPDMGFGMFKFCNVSEEEIDYWQEQLPESTLVLWDGSIHSCEGGWRDTIRNTQIRRCFALWPYILDYRHFSDADIDPNINVYKQVGY